MIKQILVLSQIIVFSLLFSQEINHNTDVDSTAININQTKNYSLTQKEKLSISYSLISEEIEKLPIRTLNDLVSLSPGVILQDDNLYMRGGRDNEVAYYVNGVPTTNFATHKNMIYISPEALEEIEVHVGSFDVSLGGANSGIVKRQIRKGTNQFHGSLSAQVDGPGLGKNYLNTMSSGHNLYTGTFSGPIIKDMLHFFTSFEKNYQDDPIQWGGKPFEFLNRSDQENANYEYADTLDFIWPGYHKAPDQFLNLSGSISFKYKPINNILSIVSNSQKLYSNGYGGQDWSSVDGGLRGILRHEGATIKTPTIYTANGDTSYTVEIPARRAYTNRKEFFISDEFSYQLSKKFKIDLSAGFLSVKNEDMDDWFGNDWKKWFDGNAVQKYLGIPEEVWTPFRSRYSQKHSYRINGFNIARPGTTPDRHYFKSEIKQWSASGSISANLNNHSIIAGFDYRKSVHREIGVDPIMALFSLPIGEGLNLYQVNTFGSIHAIPISIKRIYMDGYGYDYRFKKTDKRTNYEEGEDITYIDGPKKPSELGFYLQDKIKFDDILFDAGIRIDYLDPDEETLDYPDSIRIYEDSDYIHLNEWKKVDPYVYFQPRLQVTIPVSENTQLNSFFGKFAQLPNLNSTWFTAYDYRTQIGRSGNYYTNPVGFGIGPTTTTQYEMGFSHNLNNYASMDITGFYKIQKDLVTAERVYSYDGEIKIVDRQIASGYWPGYNRQVNGDESITKGIEFKYTLKRYKRLAAQANYTYSIATGTGSDAFSNLSTIDRGILRDWLLYPLNHNQTHVGTAILDYRFADNDGGILFENSGLNLLLNFSSGHNYTFVYHPGAMG